jgi:branched-chain amino acid transport system substrate-binding protein
MRWPALVCAVLAVAAGCGGREDPVRVGMIGNCGTIWKSLWEPILAAGELPLVERGARIAGARPSAGLTGASVGGRPVELVFGCSDGTTHGAVAAARRLVEERGATVVVGGFTPNDGNALRLYAERRPDVTFVVVSNAQATTLRDPVANLFRFSGDAAQWMAGLGSYAYRELGWRRVAIIGDRGPFGYAQAAGFVAEFCALGGHVVKRIWPPPETADLTPFARQVPADVDGVAVAAGYVAGGFVPVYRPAGDLKDHVIVGGAGAGDPAIAEAIGDRAEGILSAGPVPSDLATPAWRAYVASAQRAFPRQSLVRTRSWCRTTSPWRQ